MSTRALRGTALCAQVDPELWFPEKGGTVTAAKRICHDCPLREACLQEALGNPYLFGVWGETTAQERQILRKKQRRSHHAVVAQ